MIQNHSVNISISSMMKFFLIIFAGWFLWFVKDIIALFFVALMLAALIEPFAKWLSDKNIPRVLSVLIVYLFLIIGFFLISLNLIPALVEQFSQLTSNSEVIASKTTETILKIKNVSNEYGFGKNIQSTLLSLQEDLGKVFGSVFTTVSGFFGSVAKTMLVLVLTFYMVAEGSKIRSFVKSLIPPMYQPFTLGLLRKMQEKMSVWLRGQLILCFVIGILIYAGLLILGVKYALLLGLIAGILEVVPYLGPIFSLIPALFIAFGQSPMMALGVLILFFIVQQFENHLLVPKVLEKVAGLNPIVSILALLIGAKIGGVVGAIFSIPLTMICVVILQEFFSFHQTGKDSVESYE